MKAGKKGFTLIEIGIVTGLMGLLMVLIIPQFLGYNRKKFVNEQARTIENVLRSTQNSAMNGVRDAAGTLKYFGFNLSHGTYTNYCYAGFAVDGVNGELTPTPILGMIGLEKSNLASPVRIHANVQYIYFDRVTGRLLQHTTPIVFKILYPGLGYETVTVEPGGKITRSDFIADTAEHACNVAW